LDHPNNLRLGKTALPHSSTPSGLGRLYIMVRDFAGGRSISMRAKPASRCDKALHFGLTSPD
ncbi:hypothetical protein, partial [Sulfitobacter pontiacus]|uniref:hypothetical protein n=1 Tax=Sulfitobacter pontiacus TaxID=60137 RepID=UPI0030EF0749